MKGLPEIMDCTLDFRLDGLDFDMPGVAQFVNSWAPGTNLDLSGIAKGQRFVFNGTVQGPINRLNVDGSAATGNGEAIVDMVLLNAVDEKRDIGMDGRLKTRDLDLGRILGIDALGAVSLESRLNATLAQSGPQLQIDTLHIARLHALDYTYNNISGSGYYRNGAFDGRIVSADPNLGFLFQGACKPGSDGKDYYSFLLSLGYADLQALNLDKRGTSRVSFEADSNFSLSKDKDLQADLLIRGLSLENDSGVHEIGDITATAFAVNYQHRIDLKSDFMDVNFSGGESIHRSQERPGSVLLDSGLHCHETAPAHHRGSSERHTSRPGAGGSHLPVRREAQPPPMGRCGPGYRRLFPDAPERGERGV